MNGTSFDGTAGLATYLHFAHGSSTVAPFVFDIVSTDPGVAGGGGTTSPGGYFAANALAGLGLDNTLVLLQTYNSNDPISGTATFFNKSIASVFGSNLATPQVMWTLGNNTITYAVPEPSTYAMLIAGGLAMGGAAMRRRQTK